MWIMVRIRTYWSPLIIVCATSYCLYMQAVFCLWHLKEKVCFYGKHALPLLLPVIHLWENMKDHTIRIGVMEWRTVSMSIPRRFWRSNWSYRYNFVVTQIPLIFAWAPSHTLGGLKSASLPSNMSSKHHNFNRATKGLGKGLVYKLKLLYIWYLSLEIDLLKIIHPLLQVYHSWIFLL